MSNKVKGSEFIRLGKRRQIRFDWNAQAEFQDAYGSAMGTLLAPKPRDDDERAVMAKIAKLARDNPGDDIPQDLLFRFALMVERNIGPKELRLLLWAGLLHEEPGLTLNDVGDLLDKHSEGESFQEKVNYVQEPLLKALRSCCGFDIPEDEEEGDEAEEPKKKLKARRSRNTTSKS